MGWHRWETPYGALLELQKKLRVVLNLVEDVLLAPSMLFTPERRGVFQVDSAVFTVKVRHLNYNLKKAN